MTQPTLPPAVKRTRSDSYNMFLATLLLVGGYLAYDALTAAQNVTQAIQASSLPKALGYQPEEIGLIVHKCYQDASCQAWLKRHFLHDFPLYQLGFLVLVPLLPLLVSLGKTKKPEYEQRDPGSGRWAKMDDVPELHPSADQEDNPHTGYLGNLVEFTPNKPLATKIQPLLVPREQWCQNTIVQGGVGSGKTTGFFQTTGMLSAHLGHTLVVFDLKWPQRDSGLRELIGYWKALGRDVVVYAPFEPDSPRLALTDDLKNFDAGLRYADTVMPPPEFRDEAGAHYKQVERRILAVMAKVNAELGGTQRDMLDIAMKTPEELEKWVMGIDDEMLQRIMRGAMTRGIKDFADSMTGIISALRVFFNENVVRATTPGAPEETIDLEACFRKPTLVYFAVNQEDMLDGSGTILIRLFIRRVTEAVFRVAKTTVNGKLPHPTTLMMDEQPSYGRINYLMRLTATMRSYHLAIVIGIQNNAQGKLVYGQDYWDAISENVVARRVAFPRGLTGKDAEDISLRAGFTTTLGVSAGLTAGSGTDHDRHTATSRLEKVPLVPVETFPDFGIGEALILSSQHPPIRSVFAPITFPALRHKKIRAGTPNWIHHMFFAPTVARLPRQLSIGAYTDLLINAGKFKTLPKHLQKGGVQLAPGVIRGSGMAGIHTAFNLWIQEVMENYSEVKIVGNKRELQITIDALGENVSQESMDLFVKANLISKVGTGRHVRLEEEGRSVLGADILTQLADLEILHPLHDCIRRLGIQIENHASRDALSEKERPPRVGVLQESEGFLLLTRDEARAIWSKSGKFKVAEFQGERYLKIPLRDAELIRKALHAKDADEAAGALNADKAIKANKKNVNFGGPA